VNRARSAAVDSPSCLGENSPLPEGGGAALCPSSNTPGLNVDLITLKALLKSDALRRLDGKAYRFCPDTPCDVVYFDRRTDSVFRRRDLTIRVGQKESKDPIPVCYCFDITMADLRKDIGPRGESAIQAMIAAEVRAGHCACEVRNPQGRCCLGEVSRAVRAALSAGLGQVRVSATSPRGALGDA
jgi:hypothetical protein